eukprot:2357663-Prymnesium_polylepis.1
MPPPPTRRRYTPMRARSMQSAVHIAPCAPCVLRAPLLPPLPSRDRADQAGEGRPASDGTPAAARPNPRRVRSAVDPPRAHPDHICAVSPHAPRATRGGCNVSLACARHPPTWMRAPRNAAHCRDGLSLVRRAARPRARRPPPEHALAPQGAPLVRAGAHAPARGRRTAHRRTACPDCMMRYRAFPTQRIAAAHLPRHAGRIAPVRTASTPLREPAARGSSCVHIPARLRY